MTSEARARRKYWIKRLAKLSGSFGDDLSHEQALEELIRAVGLDSRISQVKRIEHGNLLGS